MVDILIAVDIILMFFAGGFAIFIASQKIKENTYDFPIPFTLICIGVSCWYFGIRWFLYYFIIRGS